MSNCSPASAFTAKLEIPEEAKTALLNMTPAGYVGDAALQARSLQKHLDVMRSG